MGRINWGRVIGGGLVAGLIANVLEMLYVFAMRSQFEQMMKSVNKAGPCNPSVGSREGRPSPRPAGRSLRESAACGRGRRES